MTIKDTQARLNLVITKEHKAALRRIARIEKETMSVVLRRLIRQEAIQKGIWPPEDTQPARQ